jgi:hypothetical protein
MRLISFDVGIKNMAYCIFSLDVDKISITQWDVLNLMNEKPAQEKHLCSLYLKNKKQCPKDAQYKKGEICFCKKHSLEQKEWFIPSAEFSDSTIKKKKIDELREISEKISINTTKINRPELIERIIQYYKTKTLEKIVVQSKERAEDVDLITIGKNMTKLLNEIPDIETITHIIIENQISPIATRMKTIQGMLAQYFIMKCPQSSIEFISSSNKLKGLVPSEEKPSYKDNKKNSIIICSKIVEINPCFHEWRESIKTHKKRDDLYDANLQGLWYLKNGGHITYNSNLQISMRTTLI